MGNRRSVWRIDHDRLFSAFICWAQVDQPAGTVTFNAAEVLVQRSHYRDDSHFATNVSRTLAYVSSQKAGAGLRRASRSTDLAPGAASTRGPLVRLQARNKTTSPIRAIFQDGTRGTVEDELPLRNTIDR